MADPGTTHELHCQHWPLGVYIAPSAGYTCHLSTCHSFSGHTAIMRASLICSATFFALGCFSFPTFQRDISEETLAEYAALAAKISREAGVKRDSSKRAFNSDAQRISTTGVHAYVRMHTCDLTWDEHPLTVFHTESTWS